MAKIRSIFDRADRNPCDHFKILLFISEKDCNKKPNLSISYRSINHSISFLSKCQFLTI